MCRSKHTPLGDALNPLHSGADVLPMHWLPGVHWALFVHVFSQFVSLSPPPPLVSAQAATTPRTMPTMIEFQVRLFIDAPPIPSLSPKIRDRSPPLTRARRSLKVEPRRSGAVISRPFSADENPDVAVVVVVGPEPEDSTIRSRRIGAIRVRRAAGVTKPVARG
jgi:hypothetical protein